jgi:putative effector of murein hydrolase LrgA (UPF0299 family)
MRYDQRPVHRKLIVSWYDSETACFIQIMFMLLVFLFALAGVSVAIEYVEHHAHIWLPILLVIMSAGVIVSTTTRLVKRYRYRFSNHLDF